MKTSDFYYELPDELIAQTPIEPRDSSRLLVHHLDTGLNEHRHFTDLLEYVGPNDVLVINNTKVLPARIYTHTKNGGRVEFLLHKRLTLNEWKVLVRPARKAREGSVFYFGDDLKATVTGIGEMGERTVRFDYNGVFEDILSKLGEMPLPPYIKKKLANSQRYQTVYAKNSGSCAAPTAGLHFTPELLGRIREKGVKIIEVLLHVGLGTFRPVQTDDVESHKMHSEYYYISSTAADSLNNAINEGKRIICVGTTSVRTLESAVLPDGTFRECSGETDIFIYPPYKFRVVGGLITNFHLPESTLIMLVSAFCGREETLKFYKEAVENRYRFFSFGDACLLI